MMRGLKRREAIFVWFLWVIAALMFAATALVTRASIVGHDGNLDGLVAFVVTVAALLTGVVIVVRANRATLRLARTRSFLARNPEAWLDEGPYRASMLADEDLLRLARKVGKLCEAEAATNPAFLHFLNEYTSFLEDFEPGVMRYREEARRLEDTVDRVLEHKQRGKPTQPKETT